MHEAYMRLAYQEAVAAFDEDEVPVGAVIVRAGEIIARSWNQVETLKDATAHAEMLALTQAESVLEDWRLTDCDLYVTKEPCPMCAGAAMLARIDRVVLGAWDPKLGACGSVWDVVRDRRATHRAEVVGGVLEQECGEVVRRFFATHRTD